MLLLGWIVKLVWDVVRFGVVNRSFLLSLAVLVLLIIGLVIVSAQISAPFIYTLF